MADNTKDKEMASNLKKAGDARSTMHCPVCHATLSGRRIEVSEHNKKGFSHYDFAGAFHNHAPQCGHSNREQ